jgi:Flp pilus assembly protein TadG
LIFALMLPATLCAGGAMLDYTRISDARASLQNIADSSALAANSYSINTLAQVQAAVGNFAQGQASLNRMLQDVTTNATMSADGRTIEVQITARVRNVIMPLFGKTFSNLAVSSRTIRGQDTTLELALVLDNTGSMADPASNGQSKIANLRTAATTLINTLTSDPNNKVKIGLVPFDRYVRMDSSYRTASFMAVPANYSQTSCTGGKRPKCTTTDYVWSGCVGSRVGANTVDTTSPAYPGIMIESGSMSPCPAVPLQPLSTNFSGLKSQIATMDAGGNTYIPAGLIWGWNILSPGAPFTEGGPMTAPTASLARRSS